MRVAAAAVRDISSQERVPAPGLGRTGRRDDLQGQPTEYASGARPGLFRQTQGHLGIGGRQIVRIEVIERDADEPWRFDRPAVEVTLEHTAANHGEPATTVEVGGPGALATLRSMVRGGSPLWSPTCLTPPTSAERTPLLSSS